MGMYGWVVESNLKLILRIPFGNLAKLTIWSNLADLPIWRSGPGIFNVYVKKWSKCQIAIGTAHIAWLRQPKRCQIDIFNLANRTIGLQTCQIAFHHLI